ncbi:hypothetical protein [Streptomyces huiliensis]|uniref:hypothetical protein n=1 Tax=Streptomyces huiliensis TaxID=2876027 RepID=UPI001CC19295|nr:hypothetical protein [Streptomyces huiliensis]MBZ4320815.1 hypothetical protein [Streptomyces huiliensis]
MKKRVSALLAVATLATLTLAGQAGAAPDTHTAADGARATTTVRIKATRILEATAVLEHGQSWSSDTATLVMQTDGNLVVYDEFGRARWNTGTVGQGWRAVFQTDGNFVVYTRSGKAVWNSKTAGHPGSRLAVQDDGNVVIYDGSQAIWNTRTAH